MGQKGPPTPEHLKWVIESRYNNQIVSSNLYYMIKNQYDLIENKNLSIAVQMLIGISFSLWRAAFLADSSAHGELTAEDAESFLGKMLTDNAIGYAQERSEREWTFNYYASNARYRLLDLQKRLHLDIAKIQNLSPSAIKPTERWDILHAAFKDAVNSLGCELRGT